MKRPPRSSKRASAAEVLAICESESDDSCMRAPPDAETRMKGRSVSVASSMQRVIFSPTTEPMEPIMKRVSMTAMTTPRPLTKPLPQRSASLWPVFCCSFSMRSA